MNSPTAQSQESPLVIFGGLVAELNPSDLPPGSAAICCDMDFTVGSVKTRYGVENVYSYQGNDQSFDLGAGSNVPIPGGAAWTNPSFPASVTLNEIPETPLVSNTNQAVSGSPPTIVNSISNTQSAIEVGDFCLVFAYIGSNSAVATLIDGFTDSEGNVYNLIPDTTLDVSFEGNPGFVALYLAEMQTAVAMGSAFSVTMELNNANSFTGGFSFCTVHGITGSVITIASNTGGFTPTQPFSGSVTVGEPALLFSFQGGPFNFINIPGTPTGYTQTIPILGTSGDSGGQGVYQLVTPGTYDDAGWSLQAAGSGVPWGAMIIAFTVQSIATSSFSDLLSASGYGFSIPLDSTIVGITVEIEGDQSSSDPSSTITATPDNVTGPGFEFQLPSSAGNFTIGGPTNLLGLGLTPVLVNNGSFGFLFGATDGTGNSSTFRITGAIITIYYTPPGQHDFTWIGSFEQTDGALYTLALDDGGTLWQEDVINDENVLVPIYEEIEPDTFAQGATIDDREFIALSDLQMGTDMPRQWNAQWLDRVSQVGPGAPPVFTSTETTYDIVNITQPAAVTNTATGVPIRALLWSSGPGVKNTAGNVITIEYTLASATPDPNIQVGGGVVLAGFNTESGNDPNGSYIIISVQQTNTGNSLRNSFSVQAPTSFLTYDDPPSGASYQASLSTLTLSEPASGVQVGTQVLISGTSVAALDESWTILASLNGAQLNITATSLTSDVATYDYTLITGTNPAIGEQVTVTNTTNGNGIFNVVNAVVTAASPSSFSISINAPNVAAAAEDGAVGIINGTEFQFDPGPTWVGTSPAAPTEPFIFGTSTGGTIVQPGQLGAGTRMAVVMFLTRNGYLTAPSPFATFTLGEGANAIIASQIPIGPPNVIARVIAFTGANGAFYFWIPEPVTVTSNGQQVTYSATIIHDNSSTTATFSITDAVLLAASSIDTQGSNNFEQIELGSCLGFVNYSQRCFAWGEQNKIQNLINLSFDGGFQLQNPNTPIEPAGWTVDQTNGAGGVLQVSPLFGNSYYINNTTGSTQALYGMIEQNAFQDQLATPIITAQTQYGVRVTARCPSGVTSGNLVVDLFSPSFNKIYGSFSIPFASMTDTMQIFTGNLLTVAFTTSVPNDLLYRIYASAIPNGGDVELDRTEPFDLSQPVLSTQLRASYFANFEAFDDVTGNLGVAVQNQQAVRNAFELFDNLYIVKTGSFVSTTDNGITEPDGWTVKEVSNKVGTPSINGVDVGEGWALIAGLPGVYLFEGGKPQKISPEIDPLWQAINWKYGYTLWIRNDTNNRRISIGIPLATPNQWMPNFPVNANPTEPNVILTCTYKELMTAGAIASEGSIRQGYTGQLRSFQLGRRWSVWSISAAYADFIQRGDTTEPLFYCSDTGTAKIYQQITGNYLDDGAGINDLYVTYPFLQSQEAQQIHAGLHELLGTGMTMLVVGEGNLDVVVLPDTLDTPYGDALDPLELGNPPAWGDSELPINVVGNRFFVEIQSAEPGDWFELSRVVLTVTENPWAPTRGGNF